ncbi:hypothetical protein BV25DRAFT_1843184 [Artomyces pyxidatus]|uniref:Uncharacterized protein n=1 Tax=Artomyces pyxidatus TaxID=48021 RepID=A0ACB8SH61_9AGAM|nr:hypothetical protein BV25DRAFT_1843184 [Artomyces pyxidatus]
MDPMLFLDLEAATDGGDDNNDQPDELDADFIDDAESSGALQCRSLSLFPKLEKDLDEGDSDEDLDSDEELADVVQRARRRARDANRVATSHGSDLRRAILDLTRRHQMDRDTTHPNEVLGKVRPPPGPSQANSRDSRLATLSEARGPLQFDDADAVLFAIRVPLTAAHQARHAKEVCETLNYRIGVAPYSQSRRVIWPDILAAERYDAAASFIYIRAQSWRAASRVIARTPHLSARRQAPLLVDENPIPPPLVASELTQDFHRGRACRVTSGRYAGDLAVTSRLDGDRVWVLVVPRLDFSHPALCDLVFNDPVTRRTRPPPIPVIHPCTISENFHDSIVDADPDWASFSVHGYRFDHGLMQFSVHPSQFHPQPAPVTFEEVYVFDRAHHAPLAAMRELEVQNLRDTLEGGEPIEVIRGDLIGTSGIVVSVWNDIVTLKDDNETFEVPIYDIQRQFCPGDFVQVVVKGGPRGLVAFIGSSRRVYCIEDETFHDFSAPPALLTRYTPVTTVLTPHEQFSRSMQQPPRRAYRAARDRLLHKHVRIMAEGPWKGYEGYVRSVQAHSEVAHVTLTAQPGRQVAVSRCNLFEADCPNNIEIPANTSRWLSPSRQAFLQEDVVPLLMASTPVAGAVPVTASASSAHPNGVSRHSENPWASFSFPSPFLHSFQVLPQPLSAPPPSQSGIIDFRKPLPYAPFTDASDARDGDSTQSWICNPGVERARARYRLCVTVNSPGNPFHRLIGNTVLPSEKQELPPQDHIYVRLRGTIESIPVVDLDPVGTKDTRYRPGAIIIKGAEAGQHCQVVYAPAYVQGSVYVKPDGGMAGPMSADVILEIEWTRLTLVGRYLDGLWHHLSGQRQRGLRDLVELSEARAVCCSSSLPGNCDTNGTAKNGSPWVDGSPRYIYQIWQDRTMVSRWMSPTPLLFAHARPRLRYLTVDLLRYTNAEFQKKKRHNPRASHRIGHGTDRQKPLDKSARYRAARTAGIKTYVARAPADSMNIGMCFMKKAPVQTAFPSRDSMPWSTALEESSYPVSHLPLKSGLLAILCKTVRMFRVWTTYSSPCHEGDWGEMGPEYFILKVLYVATPTCKGTRAWKLELEDDEMTEMGERMKENGGVSGGTMGNDAPRSCAVQWQATYPRAPDVQRSKCLHNLERMCGHGLQPCSWQLTEAGRREEFLVDLLRPSSPYFILHSTFGRSESPIVH